VISFEDFSDPDLVSIISDVFNHLYGEPPVESSKIIQDSKQWESAMSIRALRDFDVLNQEKSILGIGAGTEVLSYYLTKFAKQVFVTDRYLDAGEWSDVAPIWMLTDPGKFAPYTFEKDRMVVQHMDGRLLDYPDNTFDGIYSSGSIEHFGGFDEIANASYEMGRVLKPGGILTLSTEYRVVGPPGGKGWSQQTLVLSEEDLLKYIVDASGLELVDDLDITLSPATVETKRDLATFLSAVKYPTSDEDISNAYPNLVLSNEGYVFCSVHLTLRKPDNYPIKDNAWAAPSEETKAMIEREKQEAVSRMQGEFSKGMGTAKLSKGFQHLRNEDIVALEYQINQLRRFTLTGDEKVSNMPLVNKSRLLGFVVKTFYRFRNFGKILLQETIVFGQIADILKKIYQLSAEDE
jgi:SAM-dependent methyltransferase